MVPSGPSFHFIEPCLEVGLGYIANLCQDSQDIEKAIVVVRSLKWSDGVFLWQLFCDSGRYKAGREERLLGARFCC
jgi:hypothetical protein